MPVLQDLLKRLQKEVEEEKKRRAEEEKKRHDAIVALLEKLRPVGKRIVEEAKKPPPLVSAYRERRDLGVPRAVVGALAAETPLFGPIPPIASRIARAKPETALPMSHLASSIFAGAVPLVPEKYTAKPLERLALGQELPEEGSWIRPTGRAIGGLTTSLAVGMSPKQIPRVLATGGILGGLGAMYGQTKEAGGVLEMMKNLGREDARKEVLQGVKGGAMFAAETMPTQIGVRQTVGKLAETIPGLRPLTQEGIQAAGPKVGQALPTALKGVGTAGLLRMARAVLLETPVEAFVYGVKNREEGQALMDSIANEAVSNLVMNVGFASIDTVLDSKALLPIVRNSVQQAVKNYKLGEEGFAQIPGKTLFGEEVKGKLTPEQESMLKTTGEGGLTPEDRARLAQRKIAEEQARLQETRAPRPGEVSPLETEIKAKTPTPMEELVKKPEVIEPRVKPGTPDEVIANAQKRLSSIYQQNEAQLTDAGAEVFAELEVAAPGYRYKIGDEWKGEPSAFPNWVPEELRNRKLFDEVLPLFDDPDNLVYPSNRGEKQRNLFDAILDEIDSRSGVNTGVERGEIIDAYIQKFKPKEVPAKVKKGVTKVVPGGLEGAPTGVEGDGPMGPILAGKETGAKFPGARKYVFNINLERLKLTGEGKEVLTESVEKLTPELEKIKGKTLSHKEVLTEAQRAQVLRGTVTREEQKAAEATLLKTRQRLAAVSNDIAKLGGGAPKELWEEYVGLMKTVSSYAAEKGRALEMLKEKAGDKTVMDELIKEIADMGVSTDKIIEAAKGVNFENAGEVATFYRKFVKPKATEIIDYYRYVNMLSSPKTQIINVLGNLFQAPLAVAEKLTSGTIDRVASVLPGTQRGHYVREVPQYIRGFVSAIPDALGEAAKALKGEKVIARPDIKRLPAVTGKVGKTYGTVLRLMEGADVFFYNLFKSAEKEALSYKYERMGKEVAPDVIEALANKDALYRIFRQELGAEEQGTLLRGIDDFTKGIYTLRRIDIGGIKPVGWVVPFVQTPMAILKQGMEFSPLGAATIPGAQNKTTQLARTLVGSVVFMVAGYLALEGKLTGDAPVAAKEKEYFYATGRQPWSLRVGDKWVQFSKLGPLAYPLVMAAVLKDTAETRGTDEGNEERIVSIISQLAEFFADQSYLQGIGNLVAAAQGEEYAVKSLFASIPRQLVPLSSLQGWTARIVDDVYRKPKTVVEQLKIGIPGLSTQVEPHTTPRGEPSRRDYPELLAISPFTVGRAKPQEEEEYQTYKDILGLKRESAAAGEENNAKALALDEELRLLPKGEANAKVREVRKSDPALYEKLKDVVSERRGVAVDTTLTEDMIKSIPVQDGSRAVFIASMLAKLDSDVERNQKIREWRRKKVITDEVYTQLKTMMRKGQL